MKGIDSRGGSRRNTPLESHPQSVYLGGSEKITVWTDRRLLFGDRATSSNSWGDVALYSKSNVSPTAMSCSARCIGVLFTFAASLAKRRHSTGPLAFCNDTRRLLTDGVMLINRKRYVTPVHSSKASGCGEP